MTAHPQATLFTRCFPITASELPPSIPTGSPQGCPSGPSCRGWAGNRSLLAPLTRPTKPCLPEQVRTEREALSDGQERGGGRCGGPRVPVRDTQTERKRRGMRKLSNCTTAGKETLTEAPERGKALTGMANGCC